MGAAIDNTTAHTYGSALNSYLEFCRLHSLPIEPTADTLSFYTVFMCHHISPNSVDSYLSGIINQLERHFPGVRETRKSMLVSRTMAGCKRLRGKPVKRKLPLSRHHLQFATASMPITASHDDITFVSMLFTGFYALMRLGELTIPDNLALRNSKKITKRTSVSIHENRYEFWLPAHKADKNFEGNHIIITNEDARHHFANYLHSRDSRFRINPFLWLRSNGKPPNRGWFMKRLRRIFPDHNIAGQSLRAGGATMLAEDGVPPHIIQAAGRWASSTFQIYIRKHPILLHAMIHSRA
jgi:hypothetical protein